MRRKICVITGTRSEYGLLTLILKILSRDPRVQLQLLVTGMHLSPEFGLTYQEIEADGFRIERKLEILLSSDTTVGVAKAVGLGVLSFSDALSALKPDIVVVTGDRFEMFAAATASVMLKLPLAHIGGGDITEGAIDDCIRHCITKMSHLHFVSNSFSQQTVCQMGEDPKSVYNFGSPGLDCLSNLTFLSREELEADLGIKFAERNLLVTYHPETLDSVPASARFENLLRALTQFKGAVGIIFTKANADADGRSINKMIDGFVACNRHANAYTSLGMLRYLSLVRQVDAVVGNSSSGLYEVPSLGKPTVNIGNRQRGRMLAASVINCSYSEDAILNAIRQALQWDLQPIVNPYGGEGNTSSRICEVLTAADVGSLLFKKFFRE